MSAGLPLTPLLLTSGACQFLGFGEESQGAPAAPRGPMVECFLNEVRAERNGGKDAPWDAAFVHHVGYWSHFDFRWQRSSWPLPATANVEELAQYADTSGLLRLAPLVGDLFLMWSPAKHRFVRVGILLHMDHWINDHALGPCYGCVTIEGESRNVTQREGTAVLMQQRWVVPKLGDRFVRWTAADGRDECWETIQRELDAKAGRAA